MSIHVVNKGKTGEREVANALNGVIQEVLKRNQWSPEAVAACSMCVQRNQNQSAVGGSDLTNVFGIAVEIKRQEVLSINTWWSQCVAAAVRNKEFPVLVYRQNHKAWRVVMYGSLPLPTVNAPGQTLETVSARIELSWDDFLRWFFHWVERKLMNGEYPRV